MDDNRAKKMYDYHVWANQKLFQHLKQLPERLYKEQINSVFSSISDVMVHLYATDVTWLETMKGSSYQDTVSTVNRRKQEASEISIDELEGLYPFIGSDYRVCTIVLLFIAVPQDDPIKLGLCDLVRCRINVRKESSTYGIYKSIGMTSNKIRWSITSGIFILSAVGALFGVVVGVKLLPLVLQNILSQYGLIELPLIINWGMALGISCLSIIAACLSCWLSTSVISKTSPRILIVE